MRACSVVSDSLWPYELEPARLLCLPLSPGVCSNSCPLSWWCYLTILSSVALFSFWLQSFPASQSFPMSRFFASGGQNIRASASALPKTIQGWFPLGLTGLISLQSKGLSRVFSNTTVQKPRSSALSLSCGPTLTLHMTTGKTVALTIWTFSTKWCLCFLVYCLGLS